MVKFIVHSIIVLWVLVAVKVIAQGNLIPNYSFEAYSSCPTNYSQLSLAYPWYDPTGASSDYFNVCNNSINGIVGVPQNDGQFGFQYPVSGNAYAGFWAYNGVNNNYREYLQIELLDTLTTGSCYLVQFYVNLENHLKYAVNNIGLNFSSTPISTTGTGYILNISANILISGNSIIYDTLNWTKIEGTYIAIGGEKYVTIGNFYTDSNTDTLNTGNGWYSGAYYYIDDVSVILCDSLTSANEISSSSDVNNLRLYPNPNNGNMLLDYVLTTNEHGEFKIFDITGKLVNSYSLDNTKQHLNIENRELENGIYMYHIEINSRVVKSDKLIIIK